MSNDISQYLTLSEFSAKVGVAPQTMKKRVQAAEGTDYALGEPVKKGAMKLWHVDEWERMNGSRLSAAIDEAVSLGLVTRGSAGERAQEVDDAYEKGFKDGVESVISELPEEGSEDLELLNNTPDPEVGGLIRGGFQPLSALGLNP